VATPAGLTKLNDLAGIGDIHGWWYSRRVGPSEPSTTTFTFGTTPYASAIGVAYRNVRSPVAIDGTSSATNATNPLTAPSITTTVPNTRLVALYLADDTVVANWFAPAGLTLRGQTGICAAFDGPFIGPGATGAQLATNDQNPAGVVAMFALAPP
jgi:hypothetical protein